MKNGKKIIRHSLILFMLSILTLSGITLPSSKPVQAANYTATNWMAFTKFGVMTHFLPHLYGAANNQSAWNDILRNFDANWFATQVQNSGAKYVIFPIGQYDPNLAAPNATYESLLGVAAGTYSPTTDDADIIKKLIPALSSRGIRLMLYYPLSGPRPSAGNNSDLNKLSFPSQLGATVNWNTGAITYTQTFLNNIASIIKVYSDRYGAGISGWWLDDAFSVYGLNNSNQSWLDPVRNAAKSGNSNSVITINRGVDTFKRYYEKMIIWRVKPAI